MPGIVLAWLVGEGIIVYRSFKQDHRAPVPGQLLGASAIFIMLGLLAEAPRATFLAGALAWGFDVAAFLNIAPGLLTGATNTGPPKVHLPGGPPPTGTKKVS